MHCCEDLRGLAPDAKEAVSIGPVCHPGSPMTATYQIESESLTLACSACGMGIVDVAVAGRRSYAARRRRLHVVESPKVVQRMDAASRKNRSRRR